MTIRRNVDLTEINRDYGAFLEATEAVTESGDPFHQSAVRVMELIGDTADDLLRSARQRGLLICNGDGIREIEALIFDAIRASNPLTVNFTTNDITPLGIDDDDGLERAAQMEIDPPVVNEWKEDDDFLNAGPGDMWEVRVVSSLSEIEYCDFHVRAETAEEAADKAETVARRHPDLYFGTPEPEYHAERRDVHLIDEDEDVA